MISLDPIIQFIKMLADLGWILITPHVVSILFSGVNFFIPKQHDFQEDHESLVKTILKKRADALIKFVSSVEFVPESIMEVEDIKGEELFLILDKYAEYKRVLKNLKKMFYQKEGWLRSSFFIAIGLLIISTFHPYLNALAFLLGIILIIIIFYFIKRLAQIRKSIHDLKVNPDLINRL